MLKGLGYWLDPKTGQYYSDEDWVKNPSRGYQFSEELEREIGHTSGEDDLRIIGVKAGLIRIQRHINGCLSIQFYTDSQHVESFLRSVLSFCQDTGLGQHQELKLENLKTGDIAILTFEILGNRLVNM